MALFKSIYLLFEELIEYISTKAEGIISVLNTPVYTLVNNNINVFPDGSVLDNIFEWILSNMMKGEIFREIPLFVFCMGGGLLLWTAFNIFKFFSSFYGLG